ncbi:FG-GAP-like repeat-containing protein [Pedococcus sp. 5OH_020]|uniref:FG-GAP-like repeat-containing protein n=1 Tax=Pedococcus sp. 5OH_020 TaxID=2989814 RepID=UPI0022E99C2C|nr:FG-GAP-like repeat-containing protein [Pedococcus sp. 5OH_020]
MSKRSALLARALHSLLALAVAIAAAATTASPQAERGGAQHQAVVATAQPPVRTTLRTVPLTSRALSVRHGARPSAVPDRARTLAGAPAGLTPAVSTTALNTAPFSLVAVTWDQALGEHDLVAYARTRSNGRWTGWFALASEVDEHAPDPGTAEGMRSRQATAPLLGARSDGVQVRVDTRSGAVPRDLRLDLVDPGASPRTTAEPSLALVPTATTSLSTSPRPPIRSRAAWGADESKVRDVPGYGTVKGAFVHHTVNSNTYSQADVPGLIRSIYAFHVDSRGWDDIGYNFIVDRFGRIWEGRKGGVDRAVIGAHTAGFNAQGFAMAALGTYDTARAPDVVIAAYVQLFAWKFAIHGVDPRRTTYYNTKGNNAISGHRDMGTTECPGDALYAQLGAIRSKVISRMSPFPRFDSLSPAGDATGDGNRDVVGIDRDGTLRLYPGNRASGGFLPPRVVGWGWQSMDRVMGVGDFDGDGKDDLMARERRTGALFLYPGSARDHTPYATRVQVGSGFGRMDNVKAAGDLNGDGFPDIVANDNDGRLWLFGGNGTGGFLPRLEIGNGWYVVNEIAGGGDYTGDGRDDLVGRTTSGDLYVYPGPGASQTRITSRILAARGMNEFDTIIGPGSWTPDAKPDLLARSDSTNALRIYYGAGKGIVTRGRVVGTGW